MKSMPLHEVKKLATEPRGERYAAFDELARRIRNDPHERSLEQRE